MLLATREFIRCLQGLLLSRYVFVGNKSSLLRVVGYHLILTNIDIMGAVNINSGLCCFKRKGIKN